MTEPDNQHKARESDAGRRLLHERLDRFLDRVHHGHLVVKKADRAVLIEETRQEKATL